MCSHVGEEQHGDAGRASEIPEGAALSLDLGRQLLWQGRYFGILLCIEGSGLLSSLEQAGLSSVAVAEGWLAL